MTLETCIHNLRYVSKDMPVESRDLNLRVDCLKALRDALKTKVAEMGCPSERVDPLVDQLDSILATIRYVMSGDIIQPEDHNRIIDALRKARDILAEIEVWCAGLKDQLDRCVADLDMCRLDLEACRALIKPGYSVVPWEIKPQVAISEVQRELPQPRIEVAISEVQRELPQPRIEVAISEVQRELPQPRIEVAISEVQTANDIRFVLEYTIS